jgi:K+-transporting ATPase KdpF subunit
MHATGRGFQCRAKPAPFEESSMLDVVMVALALGFFACRWATPTPATGCEEVTMLFDYSLAALVTAGLLFYLTYALLRPERF